MCVCSDMHVFCGCQVACVDVFIVVRGRKSIVVKHRCVFVWYVFMFSK